MVFKHINHNNFHLIHWFTPYTAAVQQQFLQELAFHCFLHSLTFAVSTETPSCSQRGKEPRSEAEIQVRSETTGAVFPEAIKRLKQRRLHVSVKQEATAACIYIVFILLIFLYGNNAITELLHCKEDTVCRYLIAILYFK